MLLLFLLFFSRQTSFYYHFQKFRIKHLNVPFPITAVLDKSNPVFEIALRITWLCKLAMGFHWLLGSSLLQQKAKMATHRQYGAVQTAQAEPVLPITKSPTAWADPWVTFLQYFKHRQLPCCFTIPQRQRTQVDIIPVALPSSYVIKSEGVGGMQSH